MKPLLAIAVLLGMVGPAIADETQQDSPRAVILPYECVEFYLTLGDASGVNWDSALSFAACIQDASVYHVDRADQLEVFVRKLEADLEPAQEFYIAALDRAPGYVQLRAAYYLGLGQVALITRARKSVAPELGDALDPLLLPHAKVACSLFETIDLAVFENPQLASDAVNRNMVRSARELATSLRRGWSIDSDDRTLLALPR